MRAKLGLLAAATSAVLLYWGIVCFHAGLMLLNTPVELEDSWVSYASSRIPSELLEHIEKLSFDSAVDVLNQAALVYLVMAFFPAAIAASFKHELYRGEDRERELLYIALLLPAAIAAAFPLPESYWSRARLLPWPIPAVTAVLLACGLKPKAYPLPQLIAATPAVWLLAQQLLTGDQSVVMAAYVVAVALIASAMLAEASTRQHSSRIVGWLIAVALPLMLALLVSWLLKLPCLPASISAPKHVAAGAPAAAITTAMAAILSREGGEEVTIGEHRVRGLRLLTELLGVEVSLAEAEEKQRQK